MSDSAVSINFITHQERDAINEANIKAGEYRDQFEPGTLFYATWLHDPEDREDIARLRQYTGQWRYLSDMYWKTWAQIRSPLICILPDRRQWVLDSRAANGPGWTIKFDDDILPSTSNRNPRITATPSIQSEGYHGFLKNGQLVEA